MGVVGSSTIFQGTQVLQPVHQIIGRETSLPLVVLAEAHELVQVPLSHSPGVPEEH